MISNRKMLRVRFILIVVLMHCLLGCSSQARQDTSIHWSKLPSLPPEPGQEIQPGVAGPLVGVHNGALIIAGGANFPGKPPWEKGTKIYHDDIFVLIKANDGRLQWRKGFKLPFPLAYGVTVSTDKGIVCIGGHDGRQARTDVFIMQWNPNTEKISFKSLPSLPRPVSNMDGSIIADTLYIAGGIVDGAESNQLLALDLSRDASTGTWKRLPDFPGPPRKQLVTAAQSTRNGKELFIFSGLSFRPEDDKPFVSTGGYRYNLGTQKWSPIAPIDPPGFDPIAVCGGTAIEYGKHGILVFGGRGSQNLAWILKIIRARQVAKELGDSKEHQRLDSIVYDYFTKTEFHFNNRILAYNTLADKWTVLGNHRFVPVTNTNAVYWDDKIILASGERQPGIRTPEIFSVVVREDK